MNYNQSSRAVLNRIHDRQYGENSDLSWSVYGGYERYRAIVLGDSSAPTTFGGNLHPVWRTSHQL